MKECALSILPAALAVDLEKMLWKALNSRCVLAVTECARGPSFIPIRRKWEGSRRVGGACCWRRNWPHWRNRGRWRADARCTHATARRPIESQDLGDTFICVSSSSSSTASPLTCVRNMFTPSHTVSDGGESRRGADSKVPHKKRPANQLQLSVQRPDKWAYVKKKKPTCFLTNTKQRCFNMSLCVCLLISHWIEPSTYLPSGSSGNQWSASSC